MNRAPADDQAIPQREEKRFVFDDRPAHIHCVLIPVGPIRRNGLPLTRSWIDLAVIVPGIGVQRAISNGPHGAALQLVGSGPCLNNHLSITASHFGVDRRDNETDFLDQIRIHQGGRLDTGLHVPRRSAGIDAVPLNIDVVVGHAGKGSSDTIVVHTGPGQHSRQIQHVVADDGQVSLVSRKHFANR